MLARGDVRMHGRDDLWGRQGEGACLLADLAVPLSRGPALRITGGLSGCLLRDAWFLLSGISCLGNQDMGRGFFFYQMRKGDVCQLMKRYLGSRL